MEHAITTGEVPYAPARPRGPPVGRSAVRLRRARTVRPACSRLVAVSRRRDGRSPLLLAAAAGGGAARVPGHGVQRPGQFSDAAAASRDGATAAARLPRPRARPPRPRRRRASSARAVRLLNQAAQAAILMSYQGEEVVAPVERRQRERACVGHLARQRRPDGDPDAGRGNLAQRQPYLSSDTDGQAPEGVLGVTTRPGAAARGSTTVVYAGSGLGGQPDGPGSRGLAGRRQPGREVLAGRRDQAARWSGRSSTRPPM